MSILASECGVAVSEVVDDCALLELGVDSLLSLLISSRLAEELDVEINPNTLLALTDIKAFKDFLHHTSTHAPSQIDSFNGPLRALVDNQEAELSNSHSEIPSQNDKLPNGFNTPLVNGVNHHGKGEGHNAEEIPAPTSVVLQGRPSESSRALHFFPDGSGSAFSYASIPAIAPEVVLVAYNCPLIKQPRKLMDTYFWLYIDAYVHELYRRQPKGPYHLGGWSAGGTIAFCVARRVIEDGHTVQTLILIDAPPPPLLQRLPDRFYEHCNAVGLFGNEMPSASAPEWLFPHFKAMLHMFEGCSIEPLKVTGGAIANVMIVWATDAVFDGVTYPALSRHADDPEGMQFLVSRCKTFSVGEWQDWLPGSRIDVYHVDGQHHFSIMVCDFNYFPFLIASFQQQSPPLLVHLDLWPHQLIICQH